MLHNHKYSPLQLPVRYDMLNEQHQRCVEELAHSAIKYDAYSTIIDELYSVTHVSDSDKDEESFESFSSRYNPETYGNFFYFPWNNSLVRYPLESDYRRLIQDRYRGLYTDKEREKLRKSSAVILGASVGGEIFTEFAESGVCDELGIADFDTYSITNLGRTTGVMKNVGEFKTEVLGRIVSEKNPYIKQRHYRMGFNEESIEDIRNHAPDALIIEMDDVEAMLKAWNLAYELGIAALSAADVGDKSIVFIARCDNGDAPLNGLIKKSLFDRVISGEASESEIKSIVPKMIGVQNACTRIIASSLEIGNTLGGIPQERSTVVQGAASIVKAYRDIRLNRPVGSGRYVIDSRRDMNLKSPDSISEQFATYVRFLKSRLQK